MIDKDWEVAYDQFVLSGNKNSTAHRPHTAGETTFTVDKKTGALTSLSLNGKELLSTPLTLSLFRPATDNDNRDRNGARLWRKAGLDNITQKALSLKEGKSSTTARVEILNAKGQKVGTADFIYALAQVNTPVKGKSKTLKRLRVQQIFGALALILTGAFMFTTRGNEWIACLTIAAILELYTAFRIPQEEEKERA